MAMAIFWKRSGIDHHLTRCTSYAPRALVNALRCSGFASLCSAQPHFARPRILGYASGSLYWAVKTSCAATVRRNDVGHSILDLYTQYVYYCFRGDDMTKKLIQHGNSVALVLDKPILELLNININTSFEVTTDGKNLILSPQSEKDPEMNIMASLERINKKYNKVLQRLGE